MYPHTYMHKKISEREGTERRSDIRFPCKITLDLMVMGNVAGTPEKVKKSAEMIDLSNSGMRMLLKGQTFEKGEVLCVRIPISDMQMTVPVLAHVKWMNKNGNKGCQLGLSFFG
jgi:hypothetical protein